MSWFHRIKIGCIVAVWIFFTYVLMTYGDKEVDPRQISVSPNENRSKLSVQIPPVTLWNKIHIKQRT